MATKKTPPKKTLDELIAQKKEWSERCDTKMEENKIGVEWMALKQAGSKNIHNVIGRAACAVTGVNRAFEACDSDDLISKMQDLAVAAATQAAKRATVRVHSEEAFAALQQHWQGQAQTQKQTQTRR